MFYIESENKEKLNIRVIVLLLIFVSIYHLFSMFIRLIAVLYYDMKHKKTGKLDGAWDSPRRR